VLHRAGGAVRAISVERLDQPEDGRIQSFNEVGQRFLFDLLFLVPVVFGLLIACISAGEGVGGGRNSGLLVR
jgi:hypothetical protein